MASAEEVVDFMQGGGPGNIEKDWRTQDSSAGAGARAGPSPSTKKKGAAKPCGSCGELVENALRCGRCKSTQYCNRKCQKAHWKSGHKQQCHRPAEKVEPVAAVLASRMEKVDLSDGAADKDECAICLDDIDDTDAHQLPCGHVYHRDCIKGLRERGVNDLCPVCRAPLPPGAEESNYQAQVRLVRAHRMAKGSRLRGSLFTEAEQLLRVALQDDPQHAHAHGNLGSLLEEHRQDIDGAEHELRLAIECDPQYADAHCDLGCLLMKHRQDIDGAEHELRLAIECDPQHSIAHCNLGCLLMKHRQDIDGAERELRLALGCDPQHPLARRALDAVLELKSQGTAGDSVECGPGAGADRLRYMDNGELFPVHRYLQTLLGDGPDNRAGNGASADGSARSRRKKGKKGKKGEKGK
jgi:Tfp pilus assembly protein PilF